MLSEKLYFDLKRQTPFQCIFEGKIAIFLFVSGLYQPFLGFVFELLHFYESVFPLIRESISEAIKRKLSNRDYKMEKIRGHVGNLTINIYVKIQLYKGPSRQRSRST
jgi:hypothetical protein